MDHWKVKVGVETGSTTAARLTNDCMDIFDIFGSMFKTNIINRSHQSSLFSTLIADYIDIHASIVNDIQSLVLLIIVDWMKQIDRSWQLCDVWMFWNGIWPRLRSRYHLQKTYWLIAQKVQMKRVNVTIEWIELFQNVWLIRYVNNAVIHVIYDIYIWSRIIHVIKCDKVISIIIFLKW